MNQAADQGRPVSVVRGYRPRRPVRPRDLSYRGQLSRQGQRPVRRVIRSGRCCSTLAERRQATRQPARTRIRRAGVESEPGLGRQQQVINAFLAASRGGAFDALVACWTRTSCCGSTPARSLSGGCLEAGPWRGRGVRAGGPVLGSGTIRTPGSGQWLTGDRQCARRSTGRGHGVHGGRSACGARAKARVRCWADRRSLRSHKQHRRPRGVISTSAVRRVVRLLGPPTLSGGQ